MYDVNQHSFSLIPTAYGCSYVPGLEGSKNEQLVSLNIVTLNAFDDDHPANASIVDLFDCYGSIHQSHLSTAIPLQEFIDQQMEAVLHEDIVIELKQPPTLNQELRLRILLELSTEEVYEIDMEPFVIVM